MKIDTLQAHRRERSTPKLDNFKAYKLGMHLHLTNLMGRLVDDGKVVIGDDKRLVQVVRGERPTSHRLSEKEVEGMRKGIANAWGSSSMTRRQLVPAVAEAWGCGRSVSGRGKNFAQPFASLRYRDPCRALKAIKRTRINILVVQKYV